MLEFTNHNCFLSPPSAMVIQKKNKPARVIFINPHDSIIKACAFQGCLKERENGDKGVDENVLPIVGDILLHTNKISIVHAVFARRYLDVNRHACDEKEPAFLDSRLAPHHSNFHNAVQGLVQKSVEAYGEDGVAVFIFHGFKEQPFPKEKIKYDLVLGTKHRQSLRKESHLDYDMARFFAARNYIVYLPNAEIKVGERYGGDKSFIIDNIREGNKWEAGLNVDVIQIEIFRRFRIKAGKEIGIQLSKYFADFINQNF